MTNIDWVISENELAETFGFSDVVISNDFVAMARGTTVIPSAGFDIVIDKPKDTRKPIAVLGPGTGLGVSCVMPGPAPDTLPIVVPTEGGHTAFAPQNKLETQVLSYWQLRQGFVSAETLLSGPGLYRLYLALCDIWGETLLYTRQDEIVSAAATRPTSLAYKTVGMFCDILGGFAANTAFTLGTSGGVILCGGVSRHIAPFIVDSNFEKSFQDRGPGSWFVKDIPVHLLQTQFAPLYGAASLVLEG